MALMVGNPPAKVSQCIELTTIDHVVALTQTAQAVTTVPLRGRRRKQAPVWVQMGTAIGTRTASIPISTSPKTVVTLHPVAIAPVPTVGHTLIMGLAVLS